MKNQTMKPLTKKEFVKRSNLAHKENYDYSNSNYLNNTTKININCQKHGVFTQTPKAHMNGAGCPKCANRNKSDKEWIELFKGVHGDKYDYSMFKYSYKNKSKIICKIHGVFEQFSKNHLYKKSGCPKCAGVGMNTSEFIRKANIIHNNKYDYSLSLYFKSSLKIKIICKKHGIFEQSHNAHIFKKNGCPQCSENSPLNTHLFIEAAKKIHNDKYDYSKVKYRNSHEKVEIICPLHDFSFYQKPYLHLQKQGCPKCGGRILSTEDFINKSKIKHDDKYDYSLSQYINRNTKIKILCPVHGEFKQKPAIHLSGSGCQKCQESKGEIKISKILKSKNIEFERQKAFDDCINPKTNKKLKFDFYLPKHKICIEYDGEYHFKPWRTNRIDSFEKLQDLKIRDKIKDNYAEQGNVFLLRIPYFNIKNMENIISNYLYYIKNN